MTKVWSLVTALVLVFLAVLARASTPYTVKETHNVPRRWTDIGSPDPNDIISLQIGLRQGRFAELEQHLREVSDPDHARYGQHLSKNEVDNLVQPEVDTINLVRAWLAEHGVHEHHFSHSDAKDWIYVPMRLAEVERLLNATYSAYQHDEGHILVRTTEWSLPLHLHGHITTIQPTTAFLGANPHGIIPMKQSTDLKNTPAKARRGPYMLPENATDIAAACNFSAVTPNCLRTLYGTIAAASSRSDAISNITQNYVQQVNGGNQIGINDFLNATNNRSDTEIYLSMFRPDAVGKADEFVKVSIAGGTLSEIPLPGDPYNVIAAGEGALDIQTIIGITYPEPVTVFSTGGLAPFTMDDGSPTDRNEPYLTWVNWALAQSILPQVISTSYGDDEQTAPYSYAVTVCNGLAQLGARGITLLFSSGDTGVGANGTCFTNDAANASTFLPAFPASCPYITAVGGTRDYPEIVAYDVDTGFAPGAGFSNYFPRPSYQDSAVTAYLPSINASYDGLYNASGRAYPDIAAQSYRYPIVFNASVIWIDGTSCASPTASSVLSLVNDALIAAGKPTLGFLNPWLYKYGYQGFKDVVSGSTSGCDTAGFQAQPGWDAASGWGTPFFPAIKHLVLGGDGGGWKDWP